MAARMWRPERCQCVLLRPRTREKAAGASRGGLASKRVLGEGEKSQYSHGEREGLFAEQSILLAVRPCVEVWPVRPAPEPCSVS